MHSLRILSLLAAASLALTVPGCSAVRVANTAANTAVFAGTTAVRGATAVGRTVVGDGRRNCDRRRDC